MARKRLSDAELYVGPETKRFYEIRQNIRAASIALDRKRCADAALHLHEAQDMMSRGRDVGTDTHSWLADERRRLQKACPTNFGAYKPEKIPRKARMTRSAEARARRAAKKAATRVMRHAAKRDPEYAPHKRIQRGWID